MGKVCRNQVANLLGNRHHDGVHAQGVECRAEPLELPCQQHRVGPVQLLGGKATSAIGSTDGLVSRLEFVEPPGAVFTPIGESG